MPPTFVRERQVSARRLLVAGVLAAAALALAGSLVELWRFGASNDAATGRVTDYLQQNFARMTSALSDVSTRVARDPRAAEGLAAGADGAPALFDIIHTARDGHDATSEISVTVYDAQAVARAWEGRPSDLPADRINGPSAVFVTPSPLGVRLVQVEPVVAADGRRLGAVASEFEVSPAPASATLTHAEDVIETPLAPASLRFRWEGAGDRPAQGAMLLRAPSGEPLVEASVPPEALQAARADWRRSVRAVVIAALGITILLVVGPFLDRRAAARTTRAFIRDTVIAMALTAMGALLLWIAVREGEGTRPGIPVLLLVAGGAGAALAALLAGPAMRLRFLFRERRRTPAASLVTFLLAQVAVGVAVAALLAIFNQLVARAVELSSFDLRHFSLHPWNTTRVMLLTGIFTINAAVLWTATLMFVAVLARWRVPRHGFAARLLIFAAWMAPVVIAVIIADVRDWPLPSAGVIIAAAATAIAALIGPRVAHWYRHTTVAARILALFLAFLLPALLLYPSLNFFADRATRKLITEQYTVQAQTHPQTLQDRTAEALREIDTIEQLPELVTGVVSTPLATPSTDSAFHVWRQTALARARLTSAVELYDRAGTLVSRFALNFPEYASAVQTPPTAASCQWDLFGEAAPFGSEERRMLHAERLVCATPGHPSTALGTIVVHVVFDYRTLPFIASQSPYFEVFRPSGEGPAREGVTGGDVQVAIYGWGLRPFYTSGDAAWPITEELFNRIYRERDPFWDNVRANDTTHRVYFSNDRSAIFAIGYPVLTLFDHLVHLAELTTLAGAAFVLVLIGTAIFTRVGRARPRMGRALLREIRASFYRKLLLAFVLAAIIPVLVLAFVIRTYFANLLTGAVAEQASRTAAVAQRVIEESEALSRRTVGTEGLGPLSDDVMVWISQVIDQDVNIFAGARLLATSERDLFASGLLPTRTPHEVYRAIVLQRQANFVGQDQIGSVTYMLAAAPVRTAGRDALLTVPLGLRQREIEHEIDELDRGVQLAVLFFVLLGAGIGLSMAERIADPVRRLTRATRRIARGDFDERIAVRSSDELRRLVDAFNSMAAELKAQRDQLERTHRLEAWAEMARQVAHEIKNPLTPIQLSAEHLQRVHADKGQPMGAVLETCVSSILGQVRLLRQISAEFSNFASSPTARPTRVDPAELVAEVVDPYRTGLSGRIDIRNNVPVPLPVVFIDRTLVARALGNVVENALHAMPGPGSLTIESAVDEAYVTLRFTDSGAGMDEEALGRVFEPYFSTKTSGTGLGLPIARRNIELIGGAIDVESAKGVGTTVIVRLPRAK